MIIRKTYEDLNKPLTSDQLKMLEALKDRIPEPDDDSPELTEKQIAEIRARRRAEKNKQDLTLKLSPEAMKKAESLGAGYTSILSRFLENALNDTEMIKSRL